MNTIKNTLLISFLLFAHFVYAQNDSSSSPTTPIKTKQIMVTLNTSLGAIELELNQEKAPITVANFLKYAEQGFYDNTIFHRVIPGFMIQGGGLESGMLHKPTEGEIQNEANNGLLNEAGTIAMARTSLPHSATAQFFINVADNDSLNFRNESSAGWGYAVFGKVTKGMDVVNNIVNVETGIHGPHQNVPMEEILLNR